MIRDWWNGPPSSSTSTSDGFLGSVDIADAGVTARNLSTGSITTDKVADASIVSCKISANAIARTVVIPFPKLLTTWGANLSSAYVLYQPIVPMNIQAVQIINQAAMENSTADGGSSK